MTLFFVLIYKKEDSLIPDQPDSNHLEENSNKKNLITVNNWSLEEIKFFSIDNVEASQANTRDTKNLAVHPSLIEVYNSLATENEKDKFISNLISGMGYPLWKHSFVYENKKINENLILIPLVQENDNKVSGIITATRIKEGPNKNNFIINAMSRNAALGKEKKEIDVHGRCSYLKGFSGFDSTIFNAKDNELDELACGCADLDNPPSILTGGDCSWSVITVCTDLSSQTSWVATTSTLPFHLDHDRDGVPNSEDQDWYDFSQRHNISQDDFQHFVEQFWNNILFEEGEYPDYIFDDYDFTIEEAYEEWFRDNDEDEDWGSDPGNGQDPGGDDPNEPRDEPIVGVFSSDQCRGGLLEADTRDVRCDFFYVKITGDETGGADWRDHYTEVFICGDCGDFVDSQGDEFRVRLQNFWISEGIDQRMGFSSFLNIVGSNGSCDAMSPGFESCALGALALHDIEEENFITLTEEEEEHIMSFEPLLAVDILDFLSVVGQSPFAIQAVHDLIALQSCASGGENCVATNYQNNLALIQRVYENITNADYLFLLANEQVRLGIVAGTLLDNNAANQVSELIELISSNELNPNVHGVSFLLTNSFHRQKINFFLDNHTNDIAASEFINEHSNTLGIDAEYASFVESTFSWSPVMWSIAKELIGDKVIDIVLRFIPGFGQSQNLKDAIKAISHGDPLEFIFKSTQLVIGNTPLGQLLKGWEAVVELRQFYTKISRIWDKVGSFGEAAIEQMWTIVKRYPKALWTNSDLMSSIAKAIHRGIKSIDEVMASITGFTQMSNQKMKHILHGDATGGLHHASGLVNNPAIKVIDHLPPTLTSKGVYKVKIELPNGQQKWKDMFPDNKSEIGTAKSIQNVFNNPSTDVRDGASRIINGTDSAGIPIEIITDLNYNIITAYPKYL